MPTATADLAELVVNGDVEEHLRQDHVSPCVDLLLQVVKLVFHVGIGAHVNRFRAVLSHLLAVAMATTKRSVSHSE
jgi:hypothetical protein